MDIDEILSAVRATVAAIAPESDLPSIRPDRPLRQQIELDSMDWLNLMAGLHERLQVDIPPAEQGRLTTLDALVAYLAPRLAQSPAQALRATADAPLELPRVHRLADGTEVTVRAIRAQDAPLEADFVRRLSDDSRYQRFMTTLRELPEAKLKYLTDVDGVHHVALVATAQRHGQEILLGVARYIVDPAGTGCEFAVALDDAWQGSGVAGILMHTLIGMARAQGLTRMEAIVLATNRRMLQFARQLGFTLRHDPGDRETVRAVRSLVRSEDG
jgi:GNAT superfamily N-acetyltransferase/acyl carrier protein